MQLENNLVAVTFDPKTGGISSIFDKKQNHEYVIAPDRALPFRLMAPDDQDKGLQPLACNHIDGAAPEIEAGKSSVRLHYHLSDVVVIARFSLEEASLLAEIEISNEGKLNIEEIMFPCIRGLGPLPEGRLVWPHFHMRKIDNPLGKDLGGDHHTWNEWTQKFVARYPAYLASAWCDYGNEHQGLAVESLHRDFSMMDFFLHKVVEKDRDPVRRSLDIGIVRPRRTKPGERCAFPPVRVTVHDGDWHVPADTHREWVETWIRKPDRPKKFAESIGWHFYFMKHQDGFVRNTYADLPAMAAAALEAGCPYLLVFGWQEGGHDNNYFYRYFANPAWGGADALRAAVKKCRDMGVEIMPFFNGTLANVEMPEHKEFGHRWEAKTRAGHAYYAGDWARHNFDAPSRNRAMLHTEIAFCKEQQAYFLETVKRIVQDYGFGNTQLDQISEKMLVDYDEAHITTTPDRVYVDGLETLLPRTRELIREVNPEGVMISEAINEFTGQWCDSSWDWTVMLPFPDPLFYTLPWLMGSHEIDALEYGAVNKAFAYKLHLDMKIDGGDAPITKYPKFAAHVRANAELRRRVADYYVYADFRDQEGVSVQAEDNVIVKVYRNKAAAKTGIVLAETSSEQTEVALSFNKGAIGEARVESNQQAAASTSLDATTKIALAPNEVKVVCMDR